VCADWRGPLDSDDYGEGMERPVGMRPVGMRPVGMRPVGMRPVGMRPVGMRPVGMRPVGMRPVGMRPVGMRPVGMRPVGMRPVGMRPVGMRDDGTDEDAGTGGYLDPEEWSADVSGLFCEHSAVLRLGGRLAHDVTELPISQWPSRNAQYVPPAVPIDPRPDGNPAAAGQDLAENAAAPQPRAAQADAQLFFRRLQPRSRELTLRVAVRNRLVRSIAEHPELAWALKEDIARALASRADAGFLHGDPSDADEPGQVRGITQTGRVRVEFGADEDLLQTARAMVASLRRTRGIEFRDAGWVLHPATLQALTELATVDGRVMSGKGTASSLDAFGAGQLLAQDGTDGGVLLGYPFVVTEAAADSPREDPRNSRMYFSSDWGAAWVSATSPLVEIDCSGDVRFNQDETVVRAIMHHDFAVSRPEFFTYTDPPVPD
jgi:Phage capsid family